MIMYDEKILQLSYDTDLSSVIMKWTGYSNKEGFRSANEAVLQLLKDTKARKLHADIQYMRIISIPDQIWLYQDWLPRAMTEGLSYVAITESEDMFNRLSVENVVQQVNEQMTIRYFSTVLGARNWLKRV